MCRKTCTNPFPGREALAHLHISFLLCYELSCWSYRAGMMWLWAVNVLMYVGWAGLGRCCRKTVARPANLAQVSQSRLGKTNRDSPKPFCAKRSPRRPALLFERVSISSRREGSRLSEIPRVLLLPFSSPHLGERDSPGRDPSAWARCWARQCWVLVVCLLSDDWNCLGMIAMMRYMYICMDICLMECYVCVTWFMNGAWWVWWELSMWKEWVVWN